MEDRRQGDTAIEKLLARSLRDAVSTDACPDPGLVAAYCDRSLSDAEAAHLESHFASCTRCQAQLAVLVRSESAVSGAAAPTRLLSWRWLAPLAAAAVVALAVWVIEPGPLDEQAPAERAETAEAPAAPPPTATSPATPVEDETRRELSTMEQVAEMAPSALGAAEKAADTSIVDEQTSPERAAAARDQAALRERTAVAALRADAADTPTLTIPTPVPSTMWRVRPPGAIERSVDAGATWHLQVPDAGAELLAGSAPTDTICWVVGRAGTILRTEDGQLWNRIAAPASVDLTAVEAVDGRSATVTAASGIRHQTTDGGQTWTRMQS